MTETINDGAKCNEADITVYGPTASKTQALIDEAVRVAKTQFNIELDLLREYATHKFGCWHNHEPIAGTKFGTCTCGFEALTQKLSES
jgi:hypothetical protein